MILVTRRCVVGSELGDGSPPAGPEYTNLGRIVVYDYPTAIVHKSGDLPERRIHDLQADVGEAIFVSSLT